MNWPVFLPAFITGVVALVIGYFLGRSRGGQPGPRRKPDA